MPRIRSTWKQKVQYGSLREFYTQSEALHYLQGGLRIALVVATGLQKTLMFSCPCTCGTILRVNLMRDISRAWRLSIDRHGRASLYPSVDLTGGCRAHFVLRRDVAFVVDEMAVHDHALKRRDEMPRREVRRSDIDYMASRRRSSPNDA